MADRVAGFVDDSEIGVTGGTGAGQESTGKHERTKAKRLEFHDLPLVGWKSLGKLSYCNDNQGNSVALQLIFLLTSWADARMRQCAFRESVK
jgi:hypothetical protein